MALTRSDQLWLCLVSFELSQMWCTFLEINLSTSNWFIYTALPVASQLQVKHNASQEDAPASSTFFWVHCYPILTWYNTGFQSPESVARGLCTAWPRKKQELCLVLLSEVVLVWALKRKEWKRNLRFRYRDKVTILRHYFNQIFLCYVFISVAFCCEMCVWGIY